MSARAGRYSSFSSLEVEILQAICRHRLLSTAQLRELFVADHHEAAIRRLLRPLAHARVIDCVRARALGAAKLWYVTAKGAKALGSAGVTDDARPQGVSAESAASALQTHTMLVNDVGIAFVKAARERHGECGPLAWRHEIEHRIADAGRRGQDTWVRADALLRYTAHDGQHITPLAYFIELDRATEPTVDVAAKLRRYAALYRYAPVPERGQTGRTSEPLWTQSYPAFPVVLLVFAPGPHARDHVQIQRRMRTVALLARSDRNITDTLAGNDNDGIHVLLVTLPELASRGPFAPIFGDLADDEPHDILGRPAHAAANPIAA